MQKLKKDTYLTTLILIFIPLLFIVLSSWVDFNSKFVQTFSFLLMTFIVIITVYRMILYIFNRYPNFLETGLWKNKFATFIIGASLLLAMISLFIVLFNNLTLHPLLNRGLTIVLAYPTVFVLILLIYSFIKNFFSGTKESLLFVSSSSILIILILLILLAP